VYCTFAGVRALVGARRFQKGEEAGVVITGTQLDHREWHLCALGREPRRRSRALVANEEPRPTVLDDVRHAVSESQEWL
jgi:hypothetical protein